MRRSMRVTDVSMKPRVFRDVVLQGAGDLGPLACLQVGHHAWQGCGQHCAGIAEFIGKAVQVNERRAQVMRDDVGKAADVVVGLLVNARAVRSLTRCSRSSWACRNASSACTRTLRSCTMPVKSRAVG